MDADEDARFFVKANPGYMRGEALPVLVPLDAANWLSFLRRLVARRVKRLRRRRRSTPVVPPANAARRSTATPSEVLFDELKP